MVGPRSWKLLVLAIAAGGAVVWVVRARRRTAAAVGDRAVAPFAEVVARADVVASSGVTDGSDASDAERHDAPDVVDPVHVEALDEAHDEPADEAHDAHATAARIFTAPDPEITADEPVAVEEPDEPDTVLDLARIEQDLAGVEAALRRLDDGTYWTDEVTGEPLDETLLLADPVARRNR